MIKCPKCDVGMVRSDLYDPEGTALLCGGVTEDWVGYWWVCINEGCEDGKKNRE